jgi:hypothetical protein
MIYVSLIVFVAVVFWRAGWRKGLEITGISALLCLLFGLSFSTSIWEFPRNFWIGLRAVLHLPVYAIRHPSEWLHLITPSAIVVAIWLLFIALRKLRKKSATLK